MDGIKRDEDHYEVAWRNCELCGDQYILREQHERGKRHQAWLKGSLEPEVPMPPQPPALKYPEGTNPGRIVFGESVICPRCKGHKRGKRRDSRTGAIKPAEDWTRDPSKPSEPCHRCNGVGVVPNVNV